MQLDWRIRLGLIVAALAIVIMTIIATSLWSMDLGLAREILLIAGACLAGIGVAGGPSKGAASALALFLVLGATGCAGYTPPDNACEIEGTVVASLSAGLDAAEGVVGDRGGEDWQEALGAARFASRLGSLAIDGCELARDDADWRRWITDIALPAVGVVTSFIDTMAGPEDIAVPRELLEAQARLEAEIHAE